MHWLNKYHPDVNSSAAAKHKFGKIQKAYEVLSDSKQRDLYDLENDYSSRGDWSGFRDESYSASDPSQRRRRRPQAQDRTESQGFWDTGFETEQDFQQRKEEGDVFDEFFFTGKQSATPKDSDLTRGKDIELELPLEFMDAVNGCNHTFKIVKDVVCEVCKGTRADPDSSPSICAECGGRGYSLTNFGLKKACLKCEGAGHFIRQPCQTCDGKGTIANVEVEEEVKIPQGIREGQKLRFTNKGHASQVYNGNPGDIIASIIIKDHESFQRNGYDIVSEVPITIAQAILGSKIKIETLHGEQEISLEPGYTITIRYVLKNYGAPYMYPDEDKRGDHIIKFKVIVPEDLTETQRSVIEKLKDIEKSQGLFSGNMDSLGDFNERKLDYKIIGDRKAGFWGKKPDYKPGDINTESKSIFERVKSFIF
ncbi:unnamed protein product [Moneuplotes crassus]|uniref:Uncharacterized protein n=2 Tax=Euplotes crassus TaxID=5936 RepID=A0AAD1XFV6_EUPCR|nr:unnamed protein product [Moneuplotes crassus]